MGFGPLLVDECVWYRGDIIFTFYVNNGIIWCPQAEAIAEFMRDIRKSDMKKQNFDIEDRGDVSDYLGITFERQDNGLIKLSQPQPINQIIRDVGIENHQSITTP